MNKALRNLLCTILPLMWLATSLYARSQALPQPMQSPQQTQAQSESQSQQKEDSIAEAARKAKEKKNAASQSKVFTEDDLSGMKKDGISVVGSENKKGTERTSASSREGNDESNGEKYWRGKAQRFWRSWLMWNNRLLNSRTTSRNMGTAASISAPD